MDSPEAEFRPRAPDHRRCSPKPAALSHRAKEGLFQNRKGVRQGLDDLVKLMEAALLLGVEGAVNERIIP